MDERELVNAVRRGDREAAREMIRRFYPSVLRFLGTLCPNPADAEDLAQEAFIKVLNGISGYRREAGFRTWVHRIAFHEFTHRRRSLRPTESLADEAGTSLFEPASVLAVDLSRALPCVPEEFRSAFVLCDIEELSMKEAAAVLGVPVGTVKSRLHAARKRLQALLEPEGAKNEVRI